MLIAVDLDEVLADFMGAFLKYHNATYRTKLKREDFHTYDLWKVMGGDQSGSLRKVREFWRTEYAKDMRPVQGAFEAIRELALTHDLVIITSRDDILRNVTMEWINGHFKGMFSGVYFSYSRYRNNVRKTKAEICKSLGVNVLVEDDLQYAKEAANKGINAILFDAPWNQQEAKGVQRAFFWEDVIERISEI